MAQDGNLRTRHGVIVASGAAGAAALAATLGGGHGEAKSVESNSMQPTC